MTNEEIEQLKATVDRCKAAVSKREKENMELRAEVEDLQRALNRTRETVSLLEAERIQTALAYSDGQE